MPTFDRSEADLHKQRGEGKCYMCNKWENSDKEIMDENAQLFS